MAKSEGIKKEYKYTAIVIVVLIILALIFNFRENLIPVEEPEPEVTIPTGCENINLEIVKANAPRKLLTIKRGTGDGELSKVQIKINEDITQLGAANIKENKEQVFVLGIDSGDTVELSAVLEDGTICPVADTVSVA